MWVLVLDGTGKSLVLFKCHTNETHGCMIAELELSFVVRPGLGQVRVYK